MPKPFRTPSRPTPPFSPAVQQAILATMGQAAMAQAPEHTGVAMLIFLPAGPGEPREAKFITNMPEETVIAAMRGTVSTLERQMAERTPPAPAAAEPAPG